MGNGSCEIRDSFRNMQIREKIREETTRFMIDNKGQLGKRESLLAKRFGSGIVHNYRWKKATLRIQSGLNNVATALQLNYVFDLLSKI